MGRRLMFASVLVIVCVVGLMKPVSAGDSLTVMLSAAPSALTINAGGSASTIVTVQISPSFGRITDAVVGCSGLPGATCTTNPNPLPVFPNTMGNGYQFTLTVSVPASTPTGTYTMTAQLTSFNEITPPMIQPISFGISPTPLSLVGGRLSPSSITVQQSPPAVTITVTVASPIPEYPLGIPLLALFMVITYAALRRRDTKSKIESR